VLYKFYHSERNKLEGATCRITNSRRQWHGFGRQQPRHCRGRYNVKRHRPTLALQHIIQSVLYLTCTSPCFLKNIITMKLTAKSRIVV